MTKEFVSYEQALALKELGFDEECFAVYYDSETHVFLKEFKTYTGAWVKFNSEFDGKGVTSAPLYQQAFRWFREKYQLYQAVYADKRADDLTLLYKVHVYKLDEELSEYAYRWAKTYEEAEQACLDKLIKLVKEKK